MKRRKGKPELPPDPAGHQAARLPAQWSEIDQGELQAAHDRARCLRAGGHGAISWSEVLGER